MRGYDIVVTELSYESREPGALLPGETLLWKQPPRKRKTPPYCVTDRRIMGFDPARRKKFIETQAEDLLGFSIIRSRRRQGSKVVMGSITFERVEDVGALEAALVSLPRRTARRARRRRGRYHREASMQHVSFMEAPVPSEIYLQADESILWSGKPRSSEPWDRVWRNRMIGILLWMLIPMAFVIGWLRFGVHIGFAIFALLWIISGLHAMITAPIFSARRRRRTQYFLTNIRAITLNNVSSKEVHSVFLDMCHHASLRERGNEGAGDVTADPQVNFELVDNASELYAKLLTAIRGAGLASAVERGG